MRELIVEPNFALVPAQPASCLHRQRHQHLSTATGTLHCCSTRGNYCHLKRSGWRMEWKGGGVRERGWYNEKCENFSIARNPLKIITYNCLKKKNHHHYNCRNQSISLPQNQSLTQGTRSPNKLGFLQAGKRKAITSTARPSREDPHQEPDRVHSSLGKGPTRRAIMPERVEVFC